MKIDPEKKFILKKIFETSEIPIQSIAMMVFCESIGFIITRDLKTTSRTSSERVKNKYILGYNKLIIKKKKRKANKCDETMTSKLQSIC